MLNYFSDFHFDPVSDKIVFENGIRFCFSLLMGMGGNKLGNKLENSSSDRNISTRHKTRIRHSTSGASSTYHRRTRAAAAAAVSRYPLAHNLGPHHEPMGSDNDVTTAKALPVSSQSRLQHSPDTKHTAVPFVEERTAAV